MHALQARGVPAGVAAFGLLDELHQHATGRRDFSVLDLATDVAHGLSLPNTATAQELFNACQGHDLGDRDHSAMIRALEIMANHEIG